MKEIILGGIFHHRLDAKHRLSIPSKMRLQLGDGVVICRNFRNHPHLDVYSLETYYDFKEYLLAYQLMDTNAEQIQEIGLDFPDDRAFDSAGRIALNQDFVNHAGLDKEVVVAGAGNHIELWQPEAYQAFYNSRIRTR